MVNIFVRTRNVKALRQLLQAVEGVANDLRPYADKLETAFREAEAEQFRSGGGLSGGWAPLYPRYKAWKDQHYPGLPMLVLSGRLRASLIGRTADSIFKVNAKSVRFGTNVPWSGKHQTGEGLIPARPPVPTQALLGRLADVVAAEIRRVEAEQPPESEDA
jgi:phage gpG-like protein